jgi:hypothetical protein
VAGGQLGHRQVLKPAQYTHNIHTRHSCNYITCMYTLNAQWTWLTFCPGTCLQALLHWTLAAARDYL